MNKGWLWGIVFLLFTSVQAAFGGGVWLYENGAPDLGTAQAGRAAMASDASTAGVNPAGMTRLTRPQVLVAAEGLVVNAKFNSTEANQGGGDGGNAGDFVPVAGLHYVQGITEDLKLGISAGSYFGLGLDYGDTWAGRYYVQKAELITSGVNPGIGYKVSERISIGAGFSLVRAELEQTSAIANAFDSEGDAQLRLEDSDTGYGFNLGLLAEPSETMRFGLTYRSAVDLEFKNVAELNNVGPGLQALLDALGLTGSEVDVDMTIPQSMLVSSVYQITNDWAMLGNIGWQDWSDFGKQTVTLKSDTATSFTEDGDYDDTWHFALGTQYRFDEPWLWSFGMAYDTSPQDRDNRSPDTPLDRQVRVGTGIQYDVNEDVTVGAAYEYVDTGSAKIDVEGALRGTLKGDYATNEIHCFAANVIWKF